MELEMGMKDEQRYKLVTKMGGGREGGGGQVYNKQMKENVKGVMIWSQLEVHM